MHWSIVSFAFPTKPTGKQQSEDSYLIMFLLTNIKHYTMKGAWLFLSDYIMLYHVLPSTTVLKVLLPEIAHSPQLRNNCFWKTSISSFLTEKQIFQVLSDIENKLLCENSRNYFIPFCFDPGVKLCSVEKLFHWALHNAAQPTNLDILTWN